MKATAMYVETPIFSTIADVRRRAILPRRDEAIIEDGMTVLKLSEALCKAGKFVPAFQIVAGAMPVRQSIWWAALCLLHSFGSSIAEVEREMLIASASWALDPAESWKSLARRFLESKVPVRPSFAALNTATIAAPSKEPGHPAGGRLATVSVANAVIQAVGAPAAEHSSEWCFLQLGLRVAEGELFGHGTLAIH